MSLAFHTSHGVDTADAVTTTYTASPSLRSYALWTFRDRDIRWDRWFDKDGDFEWRHQADDSLYHFLKSFSGTSGEWTIPRPTGGKWEHLLVTYDDSDTANDPVIYVDGISQTVTRDTPPTGSSSTNSNVLIIGNRSEGDRSMDGWLGEAGVWERICTQDEATAMALGYAPGFFPEDLVVNVSMKRKDRIDTRGGAVTITGCNVGDHDIPNIRYPSDNVLLFPPPAAVGNLIRYRRTGRFGSYALNGGYQ